MRGRFITSNDPDICYDTHNGSAEPEQVELEVRDCQQ